MEFVQIGQYIAAFALVIGLIGLMGLGLRKYAPATRRIRQRDEARLEVVETLAIDPRSRLYIIRRDDVEHLLVRTGDRVEVIETHIPCEEEAAEHHGPSLRLDYAKEPEEDAA